MVLAPSVLGPLLPRRMTLSEILRSKIESKGHSDKIQVMPWFVYIAQARTGRYYVGITTNAQERISEHNSGKGSHFAVNQGPFQLVYVSHAFPGKSEARKREIQIKKWTQKKKEKLILGDWC
jgi:predicted GIY-YIG superfamily endonuclease